MLFQEKEIEVHAMILNRDYLGATNLQGGKCKCADIFVYVTKKRLDDIGHRLSNLNQ